MKISELNGYSAYVPSDATFIMNHTNYDSELETVQVSASNVFEGALHYFSDSYNAQRLASYLAPYLNNE